MRASFLSDQIQIDLHGRCAVPFCIFQITADEQCSGEILPVGDQCESAFEDQDKSD